MRINDNKKYTMLQVARGLGKARSEIESACEGTDYVDETGEIQGRSVRKLQEHFGGTTGSSLLRNWGFDLRDDRVQFPAPQHVGGDEDDIDIQIARLQLLKRLKKHGVVRKNAKSVSVTIGELDEVATWRRLAMLLMDMADLREEIEGGEEDSVEYSVEDTNLAMTELSEDAQPSEVLDNREAEFDSSENDEPEVLDIREAEFAPDNRPPMGMSRISAHSTKRNSKVRAEAEGLSAS